MWNLSPTQGVSVRVGRNAPCSKLKLFCVEVSIEKWSRKRGGRRYINSAGYSVKTYIHRHRWAKYPMESLLQDEVGK